MLATDSYRVSSCLAFRDAKDVMSFQFGAPSRFECFTVYSTHAEMCFACRFEPRT